MTLPFALRPLEGFQILDFPTTKRAKPRERAFISSWQSKRKVRRKWLQPSAPTWAGGIHQLWNYGIVLDGVLILWVFVSETSLYMLWQDDLHKEIIWEKSELDDRDLLVGHILFRNLIDGFYTMVSWRVEYSVLCFQPFPFKCFLQLLVLTQASIIKTDLLFFILKISNLSWCFFYFLVFSLEIFRRKAVSLSLKSGVKLSTAWLFPFLAAFGWLWSKFCPLLLYLLSPPQGTLLIHIQWAVNQNAHIPFCGATFQHLSTPSAICRWHQTVWWSQHAQKIRCHLERPRQAWAVGPDEPHEVQQS